MEKDCGGFRCIDNRKHENFIIKWKAKTFLVSERVLLTAIFNIGQAFLDIKSQATGSRLENDFF